MKERIRIILLGALVLLALVVVAYLVWGGGSYPAMELALDLMESDPRVTVEDDRWIVFRPTGVTPDTGLIFYPGARVDERAYVPPAREIAAQGYLVVIVPMPLDLAVLGVNRAAAVIGAFPEIEHWAIGGHSLGGAAAARFVAGHPGQVEGLVLWAAYPPASVDLSGLDLQVVSIYGTLDGLASEETVLASKPRLPANTAFLVIFGGNHAQFGYYGAQEGDNPAQILQALQQAQTIAYTLSVLHVIEK